MFLHWHQDKIECVPKHYYATCTNSNYMHFSEAGTYANRPPSFSDGAPPCVRCSEADTRIPPRLKKTNTENCIPQTFLCPPWPTIVHQSYCFHSSSALCLTVAPLTRVSSSHTRHPAWYWPASSELHYSATRHPNHIQLSTNSVHNSGVHLLAAQSRPQANDYRATGHIAVPVKPSFSAHVWPTNVLTRCASTTRLDGPWILYAIPAPFQVLATW